MNMTGRTANASSVVRCEPCRGTGIATRAKVLGWGISTPKMKCRHCLGKGTRAVVTGAGGQS